MGRSTKGSAGVKCDKCGVRIPKNRPLLKCSICDSIKHFKCNGLSKNEAFEIIQNHPQWTCQECLSSILPVNLVLGTKHKLDNCDACFKKISSTTAVSACPLCDRRCHKTCLNGNLGCV